MATNDHNYYLGLALQEARKAFLKNEVPIGAVVVDKEGRVVARGFNQTAAKGDPTFHAEILAIKKAAKKINDWRLEDMSVYVTVEPCLMCLGAILLGRVKEVHFILDDPTFGSFRSILGQNGNKGAYKNTKFFQHSEQGVEARALMKEFFDRLRKKDLR
jgi:tRNA(adenine34) deaminase